MRLPAAPRLSMLVSAITLLTTVALMVSARADEPTFAAPVSLQSDASSEARLAPAPLRLEIPAGEKKGMAMGAVAADRRALILFTPPAGAMISIGVSSKSGEARLSIYEPGAETALAGTSEETGMIRWIGTLSKPGDHRLVVHTKGVETPIRLEVTVDREAGTPDDE